MRATDLIRTYDGKCRRPGWWTIPPSHASVASCELVVEDAIDCRSLRLDVTTPPRDAGFAA
jgi:hypothetical protein